MSISMSGVLYHRTHWLVQVLATQKDKLRSSNFFMTGEAIYIHLFENETNETLTNLSGQTIYFFWKKTHIPTRTE